MKSKRKHVFLFLPGDHYIIANAYAAISCNAVALKLAMSLSCV